MRSPRSVPTKSHRAISTSVISLLSSEPRTTAPLPCSIRQWVMERRRAGARLAVSSGGALPAFNAMQSSPPSVFGLSGGFASLSAATVSRLQRQGWTVQDGEFPQGEPRERHVGAVGNVKCAWPAGAVAALLGPGPPAAAVDGAAAGDRRAVAADRGHRCGKRLGQPLQGAEDASALVAPWQDRVPPAGLRRSPVSVGRDAVVRTCRPEHRPVRQVAQDRVGRARWISTNTAPSARGKGTR